MRRLHPQIKRHVAALQAFAERLWYPPMIGLLSALDNFILVIPNDGILISSSMLTPRRWFMLALCVTVGSTIGALGLAALIELQGLPWLLELYPNVDQSRSWQITNDFFQQYGLIVVFVIAATPLMQQPAIILASLSNTPLLSLGVAIFFGRLIKFLIMAYVSSHAPRLLDRLWGVKGEVEDTGIKTE